ncbi:MAG: ankyrin repeat domain-containing protein [Pseudomonadota bacterium]
MAIFAIHAKIKTKMSPGFIIFILPLIGIFSGYWMRKGKYGWWRILIISVSLLLSVSIVYTAIFISPKMEQHKQQKFKALQDAKILDSDVNDMFLALYADDIKTVSQKLEQGIDVNAKNDTGQTLLHATQNIDMVKMLISKGANVNAIDDDSMTPMFNKDIDLIKVLVEAGANITHRTQKGNTTVMWYAYSGYMEAIEHMISLGVDVNAKNQDGQTAYDIAETFGHFKLLKYLKTIGARSGQHTVTKHKSIK